MRSHDKKLEFLRSHYGIYSISHFEAKFYFAIEKFDFNRLEMVLKSKTGYRQKVGHLIR